MQLSAIRTDQGVYLAALAGANLDLDVSELLFRSHPGSEGCSLARCDLFFLAIVAGALLLDPGKVWRKPSGDLLRVAANWHEPAKK